MNVIECLYTWRDDYKLVTEYESDEPEEPKGTYDCLICLEPVNEVPFYIHEPDGRYLRIHKSCGELPGEIKHPLHPPHPLKIYNVSNKRNIRGRDFACDVCFTFRPCFNYCCHICDEKICYLCISKYVEGQELRPRVEKFTPYHPHKLQLMYLTDLPHPSLWGEYVKCLCCLKDVRDVGYVCLRCDEFWSHESCIYDVHQQIKSSFHPEHLLNLKHLRSRTIHICKACRGEIKQVQFGCGACSCWFHVSCGQYTSPGLRVSEDITLFYITDYFDDVDYCCDICDERISQAPMYRLLGSVKNFHVECLVPPTLEHPCHHHQLALTSSIERKTEAEKYRCDVCEEEEDFNRYAYHCQSCDFNAHMECLFIEEEDEPFRIKLIHSLNKADVFIKENGVEAIKDEIEDSNSEDDQENEDGEEEFDLESLNLLELREKMTILNEYIQQLYGEREKSSVELNQVKLMYKKKLNE